MKRSLSFLLGLILALLAPRGAWAADNGAEAEWPVDIITVHNPSRMLTEDFTALESYVEASPHRIRMGRPVFTDDFENQQGKLDGPGRALIAHLKKNMGYPFHSLAGDMQVDVVTLAESGRTAYVFVVAKGEEGFMRMVGDTNFSYDIPAVLTALDGFIASREDMDTIIWWYKAGGIVMFIVQKKA